MEQLKLKWTTFFVVLLDPFTLLFIGATAILYIALLKQTDKNIIALLTFLVSLSSGVIGGILGKRWEDISGEKMIVARGKSAIRALKLLLGNIAALEKRVREYLDRHMSATQPEIDDQEIVKIYLEETIEKCINLQEHTMNAIQNWADVTPEANKVIAEIGVITDLKEQVGTKQAEIEYLYSQLAETKGKSEEEINKLKEEREQREKEFKKLRDELRSKVQDYGLLSTIPTSGPMITSSAESQPWGLYRGVIKEVVCSQCGKSFQPQLRLTSNGGLLLDKSLCPECRAKKETEKK